MITVSTGMVEGGTLNGKVTLSHDFQSMLFRENDSWVMYGDPMTTFFMF